MGDSDIRLSFASGSQAVKVKLAAVGMIEEMRAEGLTPTETLNVLLMALSIGLNLDQGAPGHGNVAVIEERLIAINKVLQTNALGYALNGAATTVEKELN